MRLDDILRMFGAEKARQNFLHLCNEYYGERIRMEAAEQIGEPVLNSKRAIFHNQIMQIVQKLFLRSQNNMPSRQEVGNMIMEYFGKIP